MKVDQDMICQRVYAAELLKDFWKRSVRESQTAAARMRRLQRAAALAMNVRSKLLTKMRENRGYEL